MVNEIDVHVEKSLPSAPIEPNVTPDQEYNLVINRQLELGADEKNYRCNHTISYLLRNDLASMGNVDLISLTICYKTTGKGQYVKCGIGSSIGDRTIQQVVSGKGTINISSNDYNWGVKQETELIIPNVLSRQLQPASSLLPAPKLYMACSSGVELSLIFHLKFHGPMIVYDTVTVPAF
jgi:hypothetical protein